ncbi:MAG: peptidase, partial [Jeotgalicoccus halophilus]|nr:peptidase [Jeotgalicoccus aerolatus]
MKKVTVLSSLLIAGALTFTGVQGTAQADEEEGAKTVWGEVLPADTDPDGDGWANTGFD